jgi:hypothetical protein
MKLELLKTDEKVESTTILRGWKKGLENVIEF